MKKSPLSIVLLSSLFPVLTANAALIAYYPGSSFSSAAAPVANVSVSDIAEPVPSGLEYFSAQPDRYDLRSDTVGRTGTFQERADAAFLGDDYVSFTITPDSGYLLNVSAISFDGAKGGSTSRIIGLATSVDNDFDTATNLNFDYLDDPGSTALATLYSVNEVDDDLSAFQGLDSLTFVFVVDGSNALRLDEIEVEGTVSPVPEASTYALLAGMLALACVAFRRR